MSYFTTRYKAKYGPKSRVKARRSPHHGTRMERLYYEIKPFFCILLAVYSMKAVQFQSLGQFSAILLMLAGAMILLERARHRGYLK